MAKIGIYVPDAKMSKLDKWRNELNFSRIFMAAFEREVKVREASNKLNQNVATWMPRAVM